jgi:hypothetical protein
MQGTGLIIGGGGVGGSRGQDLTQKRNSQISGKPEVSHAPLSNMSGSYRPSGASSQSGASSTRITVPINNYLKGPMAMPRFQRDALNHPNTNPFA